MKPPQPVIEILSFFAGQYYDTMGKKTTLSVTTLADDLDPNWQHAQYHTHAHRLERILCEER